MDRLCDMASRAIEQMGERPCAVGIACGGPLDLDRGLVLSPPNLPDWDRVPIVDVMSERFGRPAFLQNDAGAGALATYLWDNPDAVEDVTYITVSSGVGCGVINAGTLYVGHSGNGTELGHIPLVFDGRACRCGQSGCVEAYVSGTAIGERFCEQWPDRPKVSARDIAGLASDGDADARAHWHNSMMMLNRVVRAAVDLFDPALLCVGGGVTDAPAGLLEPAFAVSGGGLGSGAATGLTIRRTGFGTRSGVLSAAATAWNELGLTGKRTVGLRQCNP